MSKKVITFYDSEKQSHDFPIITPDYGTCSTASNTSAKVVTCDDFSLFTGAEITVKFTNAPTTDTITLNVNNSGAKNVDFSACGNKPYDEIKANGCYGFVYDGTSWIYKGSGKGASKEELERLQYYGDKDIVPSDSSYFVVNETGETITGLTDAGKTQTELVIPYEINGKKITTLFSGSDDSNMRPQSIFSDSSTITKIAIPKSVTTLGRGAFFYCSSLTSVNIPNSVTSIGASAFEGRSENLTIYCEQGSYAETYAKANNILVKYIDPSIIDIGNYIKYCVKYLYTNEAARKITINANFTPDTLSVYLTAPLFAGDASDPSTGTKVGSVTIKVPRFLLSGSQELTMSMTGAATTAFEGSALASNPEGCEGNAIYAEIIEVIKDRTINDIIALAIENADEGITLKVDESETLSVYGRFADCAPSLLKNSDLTFTSSDDSKATVDTAGVVKGKEATTDDITITAKTKNEGASATIKVKVVAKA